MPTFLASGGGVIVGKRLYFLVNLRRDGASGGRLTGLVFFLSMSSVDCSHEMFSRCV